MYKFKILEFDNYDGDSFDLTLDLGFDLVYHTKVRIEGVDTPELRGGTELSKAAGYLAKDEAREFINRLWLKGEAYFSSETYRGKYGRPLGDIVGKDGTSLRKYLIDNNFGVKYMGQAKSSIAHEHLLNFEKLQEKGLL